MAGPGPVTICVGLRGAGSGRPQGACDAAVGRHLPPSGAEVWNNQQWRRGRTAPKTDKPRRHCAWMWGRGPVAFKMAGPGPVPIRGTQGRGGSGKPAGGSLRRPTAVLPPPPRQFRFGQRRSGGPGEVDAGAGEVHQLRAAGRSTFQSDKPTARSALMWAGGQDSGKVNQGPRPVPNQVRSREAGWEPATDRHVAAATPPGPGSAGKGPVCPVKLAVGRGGPEGSGQLGVGALWRLR